MGNFKKNFAKWKIETGEYGPRAMTRFVIMKFVEGLQTVAPDRYILLDEINSLSMTENEPKLTQM